MWYITIILLILYFFKKNSLSNLLDIQSLFKTDSNLNLYFDFYLRLKKEKEIEISSLKQINVIELDKNEQEEGVLK